jgi:predicted RNase H-like nuclease (RuvC/YqgF family)
MNRKFGSKEFGFSPFSNAPYKQHMEIHELQNKIDVLEKENKDLMEIIFDLKDSISELEGELERD